MSQINGYSLLPSSAQPGGFFAGTEFATTQPVQSNERPGFLAYLACAYLIAVPALSRAGWLGLTWVPQAIGAFAAVAWLGYGYLVRGRPVVWSPVILLYAAWVLWAGFGYLFVDPSPFFFGQWRLAMKVVAITFVLSQCLTHRNDLLLCFLGIGTVTFAVMYQGGESLQQAVQYEGSGTALGAEGARANETLLNNANYLAAYAIIVIIGSIACLFCLKNTWLRLLAIAYIPGCLYFVAASGSRKGMGGLILIAILVYYYHLRVQTDTNVAKRMSMFIVGGALALGTVAFVSALPLFFRLKETFQGVSSVQEEARYVFFLAGLNATIKSPIFGLGLGGYEAQHLGGKGGYSHSTITETMSCTGFPGLLLYYSSNIMLYFMLMRLRKADLPPPDAALVNMLMVFLWVFLFFSATAVVYSDRYMWPLIGAMCGYLQHLKWRYIDGTEAVPAG